MIIRMNLFVKPYARFGTYVLLFVLWVVSSQPIAAQTEVTHSHKCKLYFRIGRAEVDLSFKDNGQRVAHFVDSLNNILDDPSNEILAVYIVGSASPEGNLQFNELLAKRRADNIRNYLIQATNIPSSLTKTYSVGIHWEELIRQLTLSEYEHREALIDIIRGQNHQADSKEIIRRLKAFRKGVCWKWMQQHLFETLRTGEASIECFIKKKTSQVVADTIYQDRVIVLRDTVFTSSDIPSADYEETLSYHRKPVVAIRSNLLLPLLNIGVDVPVDNRWSVGFDWYYPWMWRSWHKSSEMKDCFELLYGNATLRYWMGKKHRPGQENWRYRLTGHAIGLNLGWGYYDIGRDYAGHQGDFYHIGAEYNYAKALGKRKRVFLHFSLSMGYVHSIAEGYKVYDEGGHAFRTGLNKRVDWIGPTKAEVALVIPICKKIQKED